MAIVNRDKDATEQKDVYTKRLTSIVTGASVMVDMVASAGILQGVFVGALGLSGSPVWQLNILRFAGGLTSIAVGTSALTLQSFGTSGVQGFSGIAPQGSTLAIVQAGDVIQIVSSGANTAALEAVVVAVVKKTQDIVTQLGISG